MQTSLQSIEGGSTRASLIRSPALRIERILVTGCLDMPAPDGERPVCHGSSPCLLHRLRAMSIESRNAGEARPLSGYSDSSALTALLSRNPHGLARGAGGYCLRSCEEGVRWRIAMYPLNAWCEETHERQAPGFRALFHATRRGSAKARWRRTAVRRKR
jgi:hypothetical protein